MQELQVFVNKLRDVKINTPKAFQVGSIIEKISSFWKSYRKKLFHNSEDLSLKQIHKHLETNEELKDKEKSEANMVSIKGKKRLDGKKNYLGLKKDQNKFMNYVGLKGHKGGCYACGKHDHYARHCKHNNSQNEANVVQVGDNISVTLRKVMAIKGKVQG